MARRSISAGVLVVSRDGVTQYQRAFGWLDRERNLTTRPNSLFRIASATKPITAAAIGLLIAEGRLRSDHRVFCLGWTPCVLSIAPFGTPDPRAHEIRVEHLLGHRGGWDRDASGDPMFHAIRIADKLGTPSPPGKRNIVRYMLGRPLDFAPGRRRAYSNYGYMLLGLIVEEITGYPFSWFVRTQIFAPIGVDLGDVQPARTLPYHRNPREVWYAGSDRARSVFDPSQVIARPDGGFHLESHGGAGGLVASAPALARFLNSYWISGQPRRGPQRGQNHHYGSFPGAFSFVWQRSDGVNIVVLFNKRTDRSAIRALLDEAVRATRAW